MTSQSDTPLKKKGKIPWSIVYFVGGILYTIFAFWLFMDGAWPILSWICGISALMGFYYAWGAWKREKREDAA
jgi:hypothetical protein